MPVITVSLMEGRSEEQKAEIARIFTDTMVEVAGSPRDGCVVIFQDVPRTNWAKAGTLASRKT